MSARRASHAGSWYTDSGNLTIPTNFDAFDLCVHKSKIYNRNKNNLNFNKLCIHFLKYIRHYHVAGLLKQHIKNA